MQSRQRRGRPRLAATIAVALALPAGALAFGTPVQAQPAAPPPGSEAAATAQAKATGKAVPVESARTAYSETLANPDGSYTFTSGAQPLHGWNGTAWADPDATLHANSDGSLSPTAAASGLRLSGGGSGPFAVFDDRAGHVMSVALPTALPKPTLDGATAVYTSVLEGVDLHVTATVGGGITEVLVVRDAGAAANPALADLRLSTGLTGLRMVGDAQSQAVNAVDAATGRSVFSAPPPVMWDSARPDTSRGQSIVQTEGAAPAGDERPAASDDRGPGKAAHVTAVPLRTDGSTIAMAPPAVALHGTDVTYPVYIDPSIAPATSPQAYVQSNHKATTEYNPRDNLRVGYSDWNDGTGWLPGITRSYLHFGQISSMVGKLITGAHIQLTQTSASCNGNYTLMAATTSDFGSNLSWDNQPGPLAGHPTSTRTVNGTNGGYQIDALAIATNARDQGWPNVSVELLLTNESDHCGYRHYALNPSLVIDYWSRPDQPTGLTETNGGQTYTCNTTSPGTWIPAAASNQISLNYTMSSPDTGGDLLYGNAWVSTNGGAYSPITTPVPYSGGNYAIHDTITIADGSRYTWHAQADNTHLWGPNTPDCYFRYDATAPGAPAVSSTAYPANGPTTVAVGGSGTLALSAADGGTNPSGIASFNYNVNGTSISAGGGGQQTIAAPGGSASLTVALSALHWGTNTLWTQTVDAAGNLSQPVHYDFFIQQSAFGPYTPGTAGDLDGDNKPDLTTVDTAGNVRIYSNPDLVPVLPTGDTVKDPLQYGGRVILPYNQDTLWPGGTFAGAIVAHAGSFSGINADDLVIVQNGNLAVAQNTAGNATTWVMTNNIIKPACSTCTNYNNTDWSAVRQMIAIPSTAGGRPSLMTLEFWNDNIQLLLYTPTTTTIGFNTPTKIAGNYSDFAWEQTQLLGAGPFPGLGGTALLVRGIGTGQLLGIPNATAPLTGSPATNRIVIGGGFTQANAAMTTAGRMDPQGHWVVSSIGTDGTLGFFDATTTTSGTAFLPGRAVAGTAWSAHVVAIGSSYTPPNKIGIMTDGQTTVDPLFPGYAYSGTALSTANLGSGVVSSCPWASCKTGLMPGYSLTTTSNGDVFTIVGGRSNHYDVWQAIGQTVPAPPDSNGTYADHISFLGAASTSGSTATTGAATVTFTDGHTQQIQIAFTDWAQGSAPQAGNTVAASMPYRINGSTGAKDNTPVFLYTTTDVQLLDNGQPLSASGSQIASITLPNNPAMSVFAIAVN